ncbi:RNA polymerase sigma factor [Boseongicola aestuarii]|uniref:ECF RNA polymerase sigma factor SigW n=1 Tax=Boseongicola aestuarii TaxID=1470561 RepID=A0A238J0S1_9RHOB|nr:RNA polymerase sigma factor [Boseongicola aestuarii]SMX24207.1 ECF RNA polymerase sigma factor SigW [Boseongicola aestuarii]
MQNAPPNTNSESAPDSALLAAVANGDGTAARVLIDRLAPRLLSHATRVLSDRAEAEDVVQETLVRLWKIAPEWRQGEAKVSTWCFRVLVNLCTDKLRARKPHVDIDAIAEPAADLQSVVEQMKDVARRGALDAALGALPDRQRQAVVLRHIEERSNPEIAEIMDIGVEAVESLVARGKRALGSALRGKRAELGYEDDR